MRVRSKSAGRVGLKSTSGPARTVKGAGGKRKELFANDNGDGTFTISSDNPDASISLVTGTDENGDPAILASEVVKAGGGGVSKGASSARVAASIL